MPRGEERVEDVLQERAGHALRSPSPQRAFNRHEIKFLVGVRSLPALCGELEEHLAPDAHHGSEGFGVRSIYYDTTDLRFYWERVEGLRFRRKLRIRHYGHEEIVDETPVFVEVKQRVGRVTQKRRVGLPHHAALRLCDGRERIEYAGRGVDDVLVEEVLRLVCALELRPVTMTLFRRRAFSGRDADLGLRVTVDTRVRGRDRDLRFSENSEDRFIVPPSLAVVEVKVNDRVPRWLRDLTARHDLSAVHLSKYCQSVEAFGLAPRSLFHLPVDDAPAFPTPARR